MIVILLTNPLPLQTGRYSVMPCYVVVDDCVCVRFIFSFWILLMFGLLGC